MKSVSILITICCIISTVLLKANDKIDSLQNLYQTSPYDTVRMDAAYQLFTSTFRTDLSQAEQLSSYILTTAQKTKYAKGLVNGHYSTGIIAYLKGQFPEAINKFQRAISYCEQAGMDAIRFQVSIASVYQVTGKLDSAVLIYEKAITHFDSTKNYENGVVAANNLGVVYSNQGNYNKALKIYEQAYDYSSQLADSVKMASFLINIGNSYYDIGDNTKAIEKLSSALAISEAIGDKRGQSIALNTIGEQYLELKQAEKALIYLGKSRVIKEELNFKPSLANTLMFESQAYAALDKMDLAKEKIESAIAIQKEVQDIRPLAGSHVIYGEILEDLKEYTASLNQYKKAEEIANKTGNKTLLSEIYQRYAGLINEGHLFEINENKIDVIAALNRAEELLAATDNQKNLPSIFQAKANWYAEKGAFQDAFKYSQALQKVKDSLYTNEQVRAFEEMRTKFETNQKEQENELLLTKNELVNRQNQFYLAGLITVLLSTILLGYLYFSLKKTKDELSLQKQKIELQNQELSALNETKDRFFSIIAHDLRSPIAAFQGIGDQINYFLKKEAYDRLSHLGVAINHSSLQLSNLLDNLLNWSLSQTGKIPYRPKTIILKDIAEEVLALFESNLLAKKISINLKIDPNQTVFADERAVSTVFRNLINNAVKFSEPNTGIEINASKSVDDFLKIDFKDEGVGMEANQQTRLFEIDKDSQDGTKGEKGTGLGLILCKELLTANHGRISVNSESGVGSTFSVFLPINNK